MTFDDAIAWLDSHGGQSIMRPVERRFLWDTIKSFPQKPTMAEVGVAYGGTAALCALAGAYVAAIDNWQCGAEARDRAYALREAVNGQYAPDIGRVIIHDADSAAVVTRFADQFFSIVLIDAEHQGAAPLTDMRLWAPKVAAGGYLLIDDIANGHPDITAAALRWFSEAVCEFEFVVAFGDDDARCHRLTKLAAFWRRV